MGEHGSCAVGGGPGGGVIVQISNEICATRGYNQVVAQRGGVKGGGGHCARTKMQYNDVRISNEICAVGGGPEGGALCNMHVFDASLLNLFFNVSGLNWQNYRSSLIYFFIVVIPTWRCILTFDFYKKQLMRSDILYVPSDIFAIYPTSYPSFPWRFSLLSI